MRDLIGKALSREALAASAHRVDLVRPGPAAYRWLAATVDALQAGDPLRPVTIVVPTALFAGRLVRWRLAERGGIANVRTLRLTDLAARLAAPSLGDRRPLTGLLELGAVRAALDAAGGPLRVLAHHPSLYQALIALFRELRRREVAPDALQRSLAGESAHAALATYRAFLHLTQDYLDLTRLRALAAEALAAPAGAGPPAALDQLGAIVPFMLARFDPVDVRLLARAGRWAPIHAAVADVDDPRLHDRQPLAGARALAAALGLTEPHRPAPLPGEPLPPATIRVVRAPDPVEEVREVLRGVCADLEAGVPLHRVAILYRQSDPYAAVLAESLRLAGLPFTSLDGLPLARTRAGRLLLTLLRLPDRAFARAAVLDWIDAGPALAAERAVPGAAWDRLSRAANVVRGAGEWLARLARLERTLQRRADRFARRELEAGDGAAGGDEVAGEAAQLSIARDVAAARTIAQVVRDLEAALQSPPDGSAWGAFAAWIERLRLAFALPAEAPLTDQEADAVAAVAAAVAELADADVLGGAAAGTTRALVLATLEAMLAERTLPIGRLGRGVLIGSVRATAGLVFDRVHLLGLVEGAFPPPPDPDPFFPDPAADPLDRAGDARAVDRLAFLTALAAADGGQVTLGVPDSSGDRAAVPARWCLDVLPRAVGTPALDAASFALLRGAEQPWLRPVHSAQDAVLRAGVPLDQDDRRLTGAARWVSAGRSLADHPLAGRLDLPLGRSLTLRTAREGPDLTEFDGNVAALARPLEGLPAARLTRLLDGKVILSASAIEMWARCPLEFFLAHVLGVVPLRAPDDVWAMTPRDRGTLVHRILRHVARDRRSQGEAFRVDASLASAAANAFTAAEADGLAGHPVVWERTRTDILADLGALVEPDPALRPRGGLAPAYVEQAFGTGDADAWPAVTVPVAGERALRFAGVIDRVDRGPDGLLVVDYKTGSPDGYQQLATDPCAAGQHIQLALYARAAVEQLGAEVPVRAVYRFVAADAARRDAALPDEPDRVADRLETVLAAVVEGIASGAFPAVPGEARHGEFAHCAMCAYTRVCSGPRDLRWDRKQPDPACLPYVRLALQPAPPP